MVARPLLGIGFTADITLGLVDSRQTSASEDGEGTQTRLMPRAVVHEMFSPNANGVGANEGQPWIGSHAVGVATNRTVLALALVLRVKNQGADAAPLAKNVSSLTV